VRQHLSALKSFYGYLADRGLLDGRNPVERIKAPRIRRRPNDRLRTDKAEALLAACLSEQEKVLIWLLRWTGLRVGEALALTVEDVDLERRVVRVRASKTGAGLLADHRVILATSVEDERGGAAARILRPRGERLGAMPA
jgi:integrase/recombinase XerD